VAGLLFVAVAPVDWSVALLIAFGSIVGGQIGSRVGRRLPPPALRTIIICVGIAAETKVMMGRPYAQHDVSAVSTGARRLSGEREPGVG
jgi:uncharacterized membrane protein YfcA